MLGEFADALFHHGTCPGDAAVAGVLGGVWDAKCAYDERVRALATRSGLDVVIERRPLPPASEYDGRNVVRLYIAENEHEQYAATDLLHEVAHRALCTGRRRGMRDYGLGPAPGAAADRLDAERRRVISDAAANAEDDAVLVYAAATAWHFGAGLLDIDMCMDCSDFAHDEAGFMRQMRLLMEDGYLTADGAPTGRQRGREPLRCVRGTYRE